MFHTFVHFEIHSFQSQKTYDHYLVYRKCSRKLVSQHIFGLATHFWSRNTFLVSQHIFGLATHFWGITNNIAQSILIALAAI